MIDGMIIQPSPAFHMILGKSIVVSKACRQPCRASPLSAEAFATSFFISRIDHKPHSRKVESIMLQEMRPYPGNEADDMKRMGFRCVVSVHPNCFLVFKRVPLLHLYPDGF